MLTDERCHDAPGNAAPIAETRPRWASEMTSRTPDRPRAVSERRNASQPRAVLVGAHVQAQHFTTAVGVDAVRDQGMHVDGSAVLADLDSQRVQPHEGVMLAVQ